MIQIHFFIQNKSFSKTKIVQFCKNHEKNFEIIYGIVKDSIEQGKKIDLDQLMVVFSFHVVNEIRRKSSPEKIKEKLSHEFSKYDSIVQMLKDAKIFSIEARVDDFPKKILDFSSKNRDFVPIPIEQQALRLA